MRNSLKVRLTVLAAVWTVVALGAGGLVLSFAFRQNVEAAFDKRLEDILIGVVSGVEAQTDGSLSMSNRPFDQRFSRVFSGWYWQIADGQKVLLRSRSLWDQELAAPVFRSSGIRMQYSFETGPRDQMLRVLAEIITVPRRQGTLMFLVGADFSEIEQDVQGFNALLAISLGLLGVGLVVAIILQVTLGLRPLQRLRRDLDKVRTGYSDHLHGEFPQEIKPVAEAMNAVLDQNNQMIERARTHAGDLAHGLKTPLSILRGEAEKFSTDESIQIIRQIDAMSGLIDHHLARAAAAGASKFSGKRTAVSNVVAEIRDGLTQLYADREISISIEIPDAAYFEGEKQDLQEMLGNLMENACKWASREVGISAKVNGSVLQIQVADDGPGLSDAEARAALLRGQRLDESKPGTGLGLAIVRDIAELYGGEITLRRADAGGLAASLVLPAIGSAE